MPNQGDTDIQHLAQELIARYGREAELIAAGHADSMLDKGDAASFELWREVMLAIQAIQPEKPYPS